MLRVNGRDDRKWYTASQIDVRSMSACGGLSGLIDKDLDHPSRVIRIDPDFQAFRKQRGLVAVRSLKALHPIPPQTAQES